ncbi:MFS transporter [Nesterenkonia alkaliphila]|uniref:MFS transporter n=1 Tax=Nesterenkonia alkaliphila TaxID=1463631 RepID=A0A7K1UI10_9MICC|nr:MFS transporter [Nesterenkonia alkaliphila]MVT26105.1 MFS transporter [Nesterenkonia alkaliphila]GFZ91873.1 MFS transporter [Nesterenkonia alkaliphila]
MTLGRPFRILWSANALSNLSDGLAFISMPLLAASMTDDPRWVAGLATLYAVVRLVVALPIGVYVDRVDRRTLIVGANVLRGLALLVLALTIQFGAGSLLVLYAVMAVVATLESTADSSAVALLPSIVRRKELDRANSRVAAVQLVADEFIGPPLGGMLFALAAAAPLYAMGGLWAAAGLIALALPMISRTQESAELVSDETAGQEPVPRSSTYAEAIAGTQWLLRSPVIRNLAIIGGLASAGYMLPFSVLVLFAGAQLGLDSTGYGVLLAVSALGGLLGSAVTARLRLWWGYRWTIIASLLLAMVTLTGLSLTSHPYLAAVLLALYIFHAVVWNICSISIRQQVVPSDMLGRVGAASRVLGLLGLAVGSALGGVLATVHIALPTAAGAAVFSLCALIALYSIGGGSLRHLDAPSA